MYLKGVPPCDTNSELSWNVNFPRVAQHAGHGAPMEVGRGGHGTRQTWHQRCYCHQCLRHWLPRRCAPSTQPTLNLYHLSIVCMLALERCWSPACLRVDCNSLPDLRLRLGDLEGEKQNSNAAVWSHVAGMPLVFFAHQALHCHLCACCFLCFRQAVLPLWHSAFVR